VGSTLHVQPSLEKIRNRILQRHGPSEGEDNYDILRESGNRDEILRLGHHQQAARAEK
jgi:hypothetical protein